MTVANKPKVKSQSEAFMSIRKKIQEQMKAENFTYNRKTQEVEKKENA